MHLNGECTDASVNQIIKVRLNHAVTALSRGLKRGSLGTSPMWTDIEPRSQAASVRREPRRQKLPTHVLVKYTYVHAVVPQPAEQHAALAAKLRDKWGKVCIHPFSVGGAGMMRRQSPTVLKDLSMTNAAVDSG